MGELVFTSPHLFPCFTDAFKGKKQSQEVPQKAEWADIPCSGSSSSYITRIKGSRAALVVTLGTLSSDPTRLDSQLDEYLSLACPLLPQLASQSYSGAPASNGEAPNAPTGNEMDVREGGEGQQGGGEAAGNPGAAGGSSNVERMPAGAFHGLGKFTWRNQLLSQQDSCSTSCGGLAMDIGYLLLHTALWRWAKAAHIIQQQGKHVPPDPVLQAFRLLRHAAGALCTLRTVLLPASATTLASPLVDAEAQKHNIQPASGDLSPHILEALQAACFADAQSLSLLRACSKENAYQSAGLIASIAHDTAGLYATALLRIDTFAASTPTPGNTLSPTIPTPPDGGAISSCDKDVSGQGVGSYAGVPRELGAYCRYKFAACRTYALTFSALTGLRQEEKAGWAVRVAQEAVAWEEKAVNKLGVESDRSTNHKESERAAFDAERASQAQRALTKLHRDNDGVYYKRVPAQMPDLGEVLPEGRRVVEAVPLTLPIKPPTPYTQDDVCQVLEDSILASAKHKADSHPLPAPPAPAATAAGEHAGENVEAHANSDEGQQGKDQGGQGEQVAGEEPGKLRAQQGPSKKGKQGCCSVQ